MTARFSLGALVGAFVFCCVLGGQARSAIVYDLNIDVGPTNVSGTITTDGTIGALLAANIVAFDLVLHANSTTYPFPNINPGFSTALTATTTGLFWNFGASGQFLDFPAGNAAFALVITLLRSVTRGATSVRDMAMFQTRCSSARHNRESFSSPA